MQHRPASVSEVRPSHVSMSKRKAPMSKGCDEWPLLDSSALESAMESISMCNLFEDGGVKKIKREFTAKNFQTALDFLNGAGAVAEARNHHPDLHLTGYRNVSVVVYTHSLSGLTENDILLAKVPPHLFTYSAPNPCPILRAALVV